MRIRLHGVIPFLEMSRAGVTKSEVHVDTQDPLDCSLIHHESNQTFPGSRVVWNMGDHGTNAVPPSAQNLSGTPKIAEVPITK